jgi:hypothetical protein
MRPLLLLVAAVLAAPAHAGLALDSLKAFGGARAPMIAPYAPGRSVQGGVRAKAVLAYERGGYTFESDAQDALARAGNAFREAGVATVYSAIVRGQTWGFRIDYLSETPIETYTSPFYPWESDAEHEMQRAEANLRAQGYAVILGQVVRQTQAPWDYAFRVDFLRAARAPQAYVFTSRFYPSPALAQRDMQLTVQDLRARGWFVEQSQLFQDARTRQFFFQIRYRK